MPADLHVWAVPLRTRFRGLTVRDGVVVRGDAGWGEFSPFWDYDEQESLAWWQAAREAADDGWPDPVRDRIPVNVTIPAVDAESAHRLVLASGGCTTAKVKVAEPGQSLSDEMARLEAVRDALGPSGAIRVDANAAWDVDTAVARLFVLDRAAGGLEYAEQPVPSVDDLAAVRRRTHVPIAADESIRQSVSLFMWNQTNALIDGYDAFSGGKMPAIHAALSPPCSVDAVSAIMIGFALSASPA